MACALSAVERERERGGGGGVGSVPKQGRGHRVQTRIGTDCDVMNLERREADVILYAHLNVEKGSWILVLLSSG